MSDEELEESVRAWRSFIRYIIKTCANGYMTLDISALVRKRTPIAWRVGIHPIPDFYVSTVDGAEDGILRQWKAVCKHLVSKCEFNNGLGILHMSNVVINKGEPIMWLEARIDRLYPFTMSGDEGEEIACRIFYPSYIRTE